MKKEEALVKLGSNNTTESLSAAVALAQISILGEHDTFGEMVLPSHVYPAEDSIPQGKAIVVEFGKKPSVIKTVISLEEVHKCLIGDSMGILAMRRSFGLVVPPLLGDAQYSSRRPLTEIAVLRELQTDTVTSKRTSDVQRRLQDECDVALIGQSASGKTVTAAQVLTNLIGQGWTWSWLQLSEPERDVADLLLHLARSPCGSAHRHLIVLDDIQSNPSEARRFSQLIPDLKSITNSKLLLLLIGWDTAANLIKEAFPKVSLIQCHGEEILVPLSKTFPGIESDETILNKIRTISGGDLLIARLAFQHLEKTGNIPSNDENAALAYAHATSNSKLSKDAIRLLYILAALGRFEIDASQAFAEGVSHTGLNELLELRVVRPNGEFLSLGHRSLANMILLHLHNTAHEDLGSLQAPVRLAVDYLRGADDRQILATLERLDLAGLSHVQIDQHGTAFLARAWSSLRILVSYLAKQVEKDPSWNDNLASAVFAAEAFSEISHDAWYSTANFIRSRWQVHDGHKLPVPISTPTAERVDFDEIYKRMKDEDNRLGSDTTKWPGADTIDLDRFHGTWLLGILLGFEGLARKPNYQVLDALKRAAKETQEGDGCFYPSRVPWITARVVLGLCAAGESIRSNEVVRKACDWLRRPYPEGPYRLGVWESGTGTWNTDVMTTAMCVSALVRAGTPVDSTAVAGGIAYLLSKRSEWIRPGKEIDGALAMEAILLVRGRWREISQELSYILSWARDREPWTRTGLLASDSQDESSKVPFVASALISIVWETVKAELPLLLEGLSITIQEQELAPEERHDNQDLKYILEECLNEVKRIVEQNIADREDALSKMKSTQTPELKKQLSLWRDRLTRLNKVRLALGTIGTRMNPQDQKTWASLIESVNHLGQECVGEHWVVVESRITDMRLIR